MGAVNDDKGGKLAFSILILILIIFKQIVEPAGLGRQQLGKTFEKKKMGDVYASLDSDAMKLMNNQDGNVSGAMDEPEYDEEEEGEAFNFQGVNAMRNNFNDEEDSGEEVKFNDKPGWGDDDEEEDDDDDLGGDGYYDEIEMAQK